jgi:glycosyltransferase involved in cell wall biosynthesis
MEVPPTVSIIINNYNYDRFLAEAIDSALNQTYTNTEVIVVDDGSTDNSHDVISAYGTRIIPVLKQNGGQTSALNAGVEASQGEIIFFLDADDVFFPHKVEKMVKLFAQVAQDSPDAMISNYIETINEVGEPIDIGILDTLSNAFRWDYLHEIRGRRSRLFEEGVMTRLSTPEQAFQFAAKYRFIPFLAMPTSGFAISRSLMKKIFPILLNETAMSIGADEFVVKGASLLGTVYLTNSVLTKYRIHGKNSDWRWSKNPIKIISFLEVIDEFLNSKLKTLGKKAVFSQMSSMQSKSFYIDHYGSRELFELAVKVIKWHANLTTFKFFVKTMLLSIMIRQK